MKRVHYVPLLPALLILGVVFPLARAADVPAVANDLSDAQILGVVEVLNSGEIEQAELALKTTQDAEVEEVAQAIRNDHLASNVKIAELGIAPADSTLSEKLKSDASAVMAQLEATTGGEFDCAYLSTQAGQHESALEISRTVLMPDADSQSVTALLAAMEPKLKHHQQEARAKAGEICAD